MYGCSNFDPMLCGVQALVVKIWEHLNKWQMCHDIWHKATLSYEDSILYKQMSSGLYIEFKSLESLLSAMINNKINLLYKFISGEWYRLMSGTSFSMIHIFCCFFLEKKDGASIRPTYGCQVTIQVYCLCDIMASILGLVLKHCHMIHSCVCP